VDCLAKGRLRQRKSGYDGEADHVQSLSDGDYQMIDHALCRSGALVRLQEAATNRGGYFLDREPLLDAKPLKAALKLNRGEINL
jgi:hypothetical protein